MVLLVTIAFFMAVAGCFIMLELSPFAFLDGLSGYLKPKNDSIRSKVKDSRKKKEVKGLQLLFEVRSWHTIRMVPFLCRSWKVHRLT